MEQMNGFNESGFRENVIEWLCGDDAVMVTLTQKKYISKVEKLALKYPEEVKIIATNQDGSIFAKLPISYLKISAPRQISEEQRIAAGERLKKMRQNSMT